MCKLQTFPPMTDHDIWLENYFVGKIIHEDWKSDQILIDSVSYGHKKLFKTMFALARNKNPRFFEIHKISKCMCHKICHISVNTLGYQISVGLWNKSSLNSYIMISIHFYIYLGIAVTFFS